MGEFQHGLCGCFDNCGVCIITYLVPCYTLAQQPKQLGIHASYVVLLIFALDVLLEELFEEKWERKKELMEVPSAISVYMHFVLYVHLFKTITKCVEPQDHVENQWRGFRSIFQIFLTEIRRFQIFYKSCQDKTICSYLYKSTD